MSYIPSRSAAHTTLRWRKAIFIRFMHIQLYFYRLIVFCVVSHTCDMNHARTRLSIFLLSNFFERAPSTFSVRYFRRVLFPFLNSRNQSNLCLLCMHQQYFSYRKCQRYIYSIGHEFKRMIHVAYRTVVGHLNS